MELSLELERLLQKIFLSILYVEAFQQKSLNIEHNFRNEDVNMNKPLVTVFIPVYNAEKYIQECLDSIVNQSYKNLDILIIDDGSTDSTANIIEKCKDTRIRLIRNNENKGIPYTRNKGLKELRGKYLAIMDADDIAIKTRIEEQVKFLEKNPDVLVVGSFFELYRRYFPKKIKEYKNSEQIKIGLLFQSQIANPTAMIRTTVFDEYGIKYNEKCFVAQDYELWTQISKIGRMEIIPLVLHKYRWGHENITQKSIKEKREARNRVLASIRNGLLDYYGFDLNSKEKTLFNDIFGDYSGKNILQFTLKDYEGLFNKLYSHIDK
ncbi:glycosyltransferase, partial [Turicibacter sanguinis]|nr:glycosyltransferase [Turicibacter sanguinis]